MVQRASVALIWIAAVSLGVSADVTNRHSASLEHKDTTQPLGAPANALSIQLVAETKLNVENVLLIRPEPFAEQRERISAMLGVPSTPHWVLSLDLPATELTNRFRLVSESARPAKLIRPGEDKPEINLKKMESKK